MKTKNKRMKTEGIDRVTTVNLDIALRMYGFVLNGLTIDVIIDLVELIEKKGDSVNIKDICNLKDKRK